MEVAAGEYGDDKVMNLMNAVKDGRCEEIEIESNKLKEKEFQVTHNEEDEDKAQVSYLYRLRLFHKGHMNISSG